MKPTIPFFLSIILICGIGHTIEAHPLVARLEKFGFTCATQTRPIPSHQCRGHLDHFSQPTHFFFPTSFDLDKEVALAVHFLGFWTNNNFNPFAKNIGDFGSYAAQTKKNVLLIVPESRGKNSHYKSELNSALQWNQFFSDILDLLGESNRSRILSFIFSGHSGAYTTLAKLGALIHQDKIKAINKLGGFALLDSAYGFRQGLVDIASEMHFKSTYFIAFNPADGSNAKLHTNRQLYKLLKKGQFTLEYFENKNLGHNDFVPAYLPLFLQAALAHFP